MRKTKKTTAQKEARAKFNGCIARLDSIIKKLDDWLAESRFERELLHAKWEARNG